MGSFYAEFGKRGGKRCSKDVLKQIESLKESNVEGIILDLRDTIGTLITILLKKNKTTLIEASNENQEDPQQIASTAS